MNYAHTDLLCYRAESESRLAAREAAAWDPLLEWAAEALGARLRVAQGMAPVAQSTEALEALQGALARESAFALTALHAIAALTGSLMLGFALSRGRCEAEEVWAAATIEEAWQAERWGVDAQAQTHAAARKVELHTLARFLKLAGDQT
jgi:chaperone required for assembly of F1-ATPase